MGDAVIAASPPNDGREWDVQCARCGSSASFERCGYCGGEGEVLDDDDPEEEEFARCACCEGSSGWNVCLSDPAWCEAHPLPGREQVERGALEWFVLERGCVMGDVQVTPTATDLLAEVRRLRAEAESNTRLVLSVVALMEAAIQRCDECDDPATVVEEGERTCHFCDRHRVEGRGNDLPWAAQTREAARVLDDVTRVDSLIDAAPRDTVEGLAERLREAQSAALWLAPLARDGAKAERALQDTRHTLESFVEDFYSLQADAARVVRAWESGNTDDLRRAVESLRDGGLPGWVEKALEGGR